MRKLISLFCCALSLGAWNIQSARADYATYEEARAAARANANEHKYTAARLDLEKAVDLAKTPDDKSTALSLIGETYKLENKGEQAREVWRKLAAMPDAPANARVYAQMSIGFSLADADKPALARAELLKVATIKGATLVPTESALLGFSIGSTYSNEKNYEQARKQWSETLARDFKGEGVAPILEIIRLSFAESFLDEGKYEQARSEYARFLAEKEDEKLPPDEHAAIATLKQRAQLDVARSFLLQKDYARAKTEYERIAKLPLQADMKAEADKKLQFIADQTAPSETAKK